MAKKANNNNTKKKPQRQNTELIIGIAILLVIAVLLIMYFVWPEGDKAGMDNINDSISEELAPKDEGSKLTETGEIDKSDARRVRVTMNDGKGFIMELYPHVAPETVANFMKLVNEGFYDGLIFHRVIEGFMAQGGAYDPVNQMNDPADSIKGEFASNGFDNKLSHTRGVVSMARTSNPDSASSQFFICYDDASFLDGDYAAFGMVTEGMEVVDSFLDAGTDEYDMPLKEVKIMTIEEIE